MPTHYEESAQLNTIVQRLIDSLDEFADLRDLRITPLIIEKTKKDKEGNEETVEGKPAISAKKVPPLFYHMTGGDRAGTQYVLLFDKYCWNKMDTDERDANVHSMLCMLDPQSKQNGDLVLKMKKPDVVTFKATLRRFGCFDAEMDLVRQTLEDSSRRVASRLFSSGVTVEVSRAVRNSDEADIPDADEGVPVEGVPVEESQTPTISRRSRRGEAVLRAGEED